MRLAIYSLASILTIWGVVFCLFVVDSLMYDVPKKYCDNVVVLTGEKKRIPLAIESVDINKTKNIFISGVYKKTTLNDILKNNKNVHGVTFILGKKAKNTRENAIEINEWILANKIERILLITSDYHMRRSVMEIRYINKNVEIIPYPSRSSFDLRFIKYCAKEFHKIIYNFIKKKIDA